jgi:hypothetical protein
VPVHALELSLECISILLNTGWKGDLSPALAGQLLILFTFLANPSSAENGIPATSEELQTAAFKCMAELLAEVSRTSQGRAYLTETANIPNLGKSVLVMLDSVTEVKSNAVRLQALAAVQALISGIDDLDALASFLPRMVSSLTKLLTPSSTKRAAFRVIERGLETMSILLVRVLSDQETQNLPSQSTKNTENSSDAVMRTTAWLSATTTQIKIALANMLKLRNHDKKEVRHALLQLCLRVVQQCRTSLVDCISMVTETMVTLAGRGGEHDTVENDLKALLYSDEKLSELLRESLRGWVISLPRLMQSKDDASRRQIIQQISTAVRLLNNEQIDLTRIDDLLAGNLRDGLSTILGESKTLGPLVESTDLARIDTSVMISNVHSTAFQPLELRFKGQDDMMKEFRYLLQALSKSNSAPTVAQDLVSTTENGSEDTQLASFWLSVNLLKEMISYSAVTDDFLDLGTTNIQDELLDILYENSLARLRNQVSNESHWHFQTLALEVLALQASRYKIDFRPELVEGLYPVLHLLGTPNPALRNHAMTCLNILADACGYSSASDLVISNVDYIINAVGLQLNYQDISPQAPQVLLMMMRLCGPTLLPYLDDLVASMFSALERFHGYPKLVELLFSVLGGMAEEGVKAPQLTITSDEPNQRQLSKPASMSDITTAIKSMELDALRQDEEHQETIEAFPRRPWKDPTKDPEEAGEPEAPHENEEDDQAVTAPDPPPPTPRTFDIILKISDLTQHHLTSSSPSLRASLLSLLHTTIPALARHENSFLPLINTLWPVLLPRIDDPEAYVVANALDIVALMCTQAGNFMKGRIEGAWNDIKAVHRRALKKTDNQKPGMTNLQISHKADNLAPVGSTSDEIYRPELYVSAPIRMISDSLTSCLCAIGKHVAIREDYFDDILDMLDPVLERSEVRESLECRNTDAVWLRLYEKSRKQVAEKGSGTERSAEPYILIGKVPDGLSRWNFVKVQ